MAEQAAALAALASVGGGEATAAVVRAIVRGEVQGAARAAAVAAAGILAATLPGQAVLPLLCDDDPAVRADACRCAGPEPRVVAAVEDLLGDLNGGVRLAAASALGRHGREAARPVLMAALREQPTAALVEALILDDLAYVAKDQAETSVLFELIGARYERRSLLITANQPFGEWGKVFPDQAMTLAAVDRLVHHATILEMNVESFRRRTALERKRGPGRPPGRATIKASS